MAGINGEDFQPKGFLVTPPNGPPKGPPEGPPKGLDFIGIFGTSSGPAFGLLIVGTSSFVFVIFILGKLIFF